MGDLGSILGLGRSPEEGKGYPLQYSDLENSMDCIVHGVSKSQTQLSNFHFTSVELDNRQEVDPLSKLLEISPEAFSIQCLPFAKPNKKPAEWELRNVVCKGQLFGT